MTAVCDTVTDVIHSTAADMLSGKLGKRRASRPSSGSAGALNTPGNQETHAESVGTDRKSWMGES